MMIGPKTGPTASPDKSRKHLKIIFFLQILHYVLIYIYFVYYIVYSIASKSYYPFYFGINIQDVSKNENSNNFFVFQPISKIPFKTCRVLQGESIPKKNL